jgi:predicted PurR-regulated permease PerM
MKREYVLITLFFLVAAASVYLFYIIIVPFFVPICWAAIFVISFYPLYGRLNRHINHPTLSSLVMCLLILVLVIGPVTYLFISLVGQASDAVTRVNEMYKSGELDQYFSVDIPWVQALKTRLAAYVDFSKVNIGEFVKDAVAKVGSLIVNQTSWLIANATRAVIDFFLMIFCIYYFFKEGPSLVDRIRRLMPLPPDQTAITFDRLRDVVYATMYSGVAVALLQGLLGGILFWIFGIQSPVFWGALMAFLSVLPIVGSAIIYVPAGLLLIIGGSTIKGLLLIALCGVIISQADHLVRPLLVSGRTSMHPLLLLFSIAGGITLFGLIGIVIGPLIAAIFMTLLEIIELRLKPPAPESGSAD